ncbi:MAG TPA: AfsR/SARP family transcriptional regulator [Streptosporangiaceae bacterium]|nr:AfsR/SARP family transcriptional regulator [Streptosporangiaceae bacterium]
MQFRILGTLEARKAGERLPLGGHGDQKLLAVLLLEANRVVPVTRLVEVLWDDGPPGSAVKQVRNAVSRLRRLFAASGEPGAIVTDGGGYRLVVPDGALDTAVFESQVARAGALACAGDAAQAAGLLRSALDLWRGPALAGLPGRVFEAAAAAWDERRCAAAEMYFDCQLLLGRHREVLGELWALAADYPLRAGPVGQLMLALYRCGRQADALALYSKTRMLLAEEVGLDPGPVLQHLHQQILTASPALTAPPPANGHPPGRPRGAGGLRQAALPGRCQSRREPARGRRRHT